MRNIRFVGFLTLIAAVLGTSTQGFAAAMYQHLYELNGTFADSQGGPSMVTGGGTLGGSGYTFAVHQGPSLSNAVDPNTYSIEMKVTIDSTSSYKRLLSFDNHTSESGLYNNGTHGVLFYVPPEINAGTTSITAGVPANLIVTRDGSTKQFNAYVNGVLQISFTDSSDKGVFSAAGNIIQFLIDDDSSGGTAEDPSGFLDYVHLYSGVLTQAQATGLANGSLTAFDIPEPASFGLLALGGLALLRRGRTQKRQPR